MNTFENIEAAINGNTQRVKALHKARRTIEQALEDVTTLDFNEPDQQMMLEQLEAQKKDNADDAWETYLRLLEAESLLGDLAHHITIMQSSLTRAKHEAVKLSK